MRPPHPVGRAFQIAGVLLAKAESWDAAATAFERALRRDAEDARCLARLGSARTHLRQWQAASAAYEAALAIDDRPAEWHAGLAFALARRNRWSAAIRSYEAAIARDGANARWHMRLGKARARTRDWAGAADAFAAAAKHDGGNPRWRVLHWQALERAAAQRARAAGQGSTGGSPRTLREQARAARSDFRQLQYKRLRRSSSAAEIDRRLVAAHPGRLKIRRRITHAIAASVDSIHRGAQTPSEPLQELGPSIFVFWAQGIGNAPPVVQVCHRELLRLHGDAEVRTIDSSTIGQYVDLPAATVSRMGSDRTLLSDLLRLELLSRYGGIWLDATCLPRVHLAAVGGLTQPSGFFAFTARRFRPASWFLMSDADNYIVTMLREGLHAYWREFDRAIDYFVLHHVFEALCLVDERFAAQWEQTPAVSRSGPSELRRAIAEPYSPRTFAQMLDACFIHKLTHKYDPESIPPGSMLARLLDRGPPPVASDIPLPG